MAAVAAETETVIELATGKVRLLQGGQGDPLVVLHHDIGNPGWLPFHQELAGRFQVFAPDLPGYGQSERPEWARHPRDLAIATEQLLAKLELDGVTLVGLGFGGWLAAEMATMNPRALRALVLVGAFGMLPGEGEIFDQIMVSHVDYVKRGFRSDAEFERQFGAEPSREQAFSWDLNKEMTARITWKPYMFSHQLPHLLRGVETPTLIVWGREDKIAPLSCGELYAGALPNARLTVMDETGHFVEMERPAELARLILDHVGGIDSR